MKQFMGGKEMENAKRARELEQWLLAKQNECKTKNRFIVFGYLHMNFRASPDR